MIINSDFCVAQGFTLHRSHMVTSSINPNPRRLIMRRSLFTAILFGAASLAAFGQAASPTDAGQDHKDVRQDQRDARQDTRDARNDRSGMRQDRTDIRQDMKDGNFADAAKDRKDLRQDRRDKKQDKKEARQD